MIGAITVIAWAFLKLGLCRQFALEADNGCLGGDDHIILPPGEPNPESSPAVSSDTPGETIVTGAILRLCSKRIRKMIRGAFTVCTSGVLCYFAFCVFMQHTGSPVASAVALSVSVCGAALCLLGCHRHSPAISIALSLLVAGMTASQTSHWFAGAPLYAPFGVLSIAGGICAGTATCLTMCFFWRKRATVRSSTPNDPVVRSKNTNDTEVL